jgi:protein ImuA
MAFVEESAAIPIERLRRELCRREAMNSLSGQCGPSVTLGITSIDGALDGGLARGALHEIAAARETHLPAASIFALALAVRAMKKVERSSSQTLSWKPAAAVLWIAEDLSLAENGAPYGPGLADTGISPDRLIAIAAARVRDVLWAMEEALRCRAVGVVIGEMRARDIDPVATRRLSHAAATGGTFGLLLRSTPDDAPSAATTRWIIGAAPAREQTGERRDFDPPRLSARLMRNRRGRLGAWILEWNSVEQRFELPTHSQLVAGAAFDRPHRATVA